MLIAKLNAYGVDISALRLMDLYAKSFGSAFLGERLNPMFIAITYFPIVTYYRGF